VTAAKGADWGPGLELAGGRYLLTQRLAGGGMADIFSAYDRHLGAEVVIKAPLPDLLRHPAFAARFAREARALVRLAHPHVVRALDAGEHAGVPYLVLQYLPGGSLRHRQLGPGGQVRPLPVEHLGRWLLPVAQALDFIHTQGFVHRDVKPGNILFDGHGHAYLGDFGVVKALAGAPPELAAELTQRGVVLGTLQYMAPEVFRGKPYDGRADQYALAVTCYEAVAGRWPFEGSNPAQVMVQQLNSSPPALEVLRPGAVPASLARAVEKGLAKEPTERYGSCQELAAAVLACLPQPAAQTARRAATPLACPLCQEEVHVLGDGLVTCPGCGAHLTLSPDGLALTVTGREGVPSAGGPPMTFSLPLDTSEVGMSLPRAAQALRTLRPGPLAAAKPPAAEWPDEPPHWQGTDQPSRRGWKVALGLAVGLLAAAGLALGGLLLFRHFLEKEDAAHFEVSPPVRSPKWVVSARGEGNFTTLGAAVRAAPDGTTIRVRPGVYEESLVLNRPLRLQADGPAGRVIIRSRGVPCLRLRGTGISIRGMTFQVRGGPGPRGFALEVGRGRVELRVCDVSSPRGGGVRVCGPGSVLLLRDCRVHSCAGAGVVFDDRARGTLDGCWLVANAGPGLVSRRGARPVLNRCRITDGIKGAVLFEEGGEGRLERSQIEDNGGPGVEVGRACRPTFHRCRISRGQSFGVYAHRQGGGTFADCDIGHNALAGVACRQGGRPTFRNCRIHHGKQSGILIHEQGGGKFVNCFVHHNALAGVEVRGRSNPQLRDCDIAANAFAGVQVSARAAPVLTGCRIRDGRQSGVLVLGRGRGRFDQCRIYGNRLVGVEVKSEGDPVLDRCPIYNCKEGGVLVHDQGKGTFTGCEIYDNDLRVGVMISTAADPVFRKCKVHDGRSAGVVIFERGKGTLEDCEVFDNARSGVEIRGGSKPVLRRCKITRNLGRGVWAYGKSVAVMEQCDLRGNKQGARMVAEGSKLEGAGNKE
jgi:F-box protein 11